MIEKPKKKKKGRYKPGRLSPSAYKKLCEDLFIKRGCGCERCGSINGLSFHHIKKRSRGGADISSNLMLLCLECHEAEHGANVKKH